MYTLVQSDPALRREEEEESSSEVLDQRDREDGKLDKMFHCYETEGTKERRDRADSVLQNQTTQTSPLHQLTSCQ